MKRLSLRITTATAGAAAIGLSCLACGSGQQAHTTPSSQKPVLRSVQPLGTSGARQPAASHPPGALRSVASRTAGNPVGARSSPGGPRRAVVARTSGPAATTVQLPRGSYPVDPGCAGRRTVPVGGNRPLPVRVMCPPP